MSNFLTQTFFLIIEPSNEETISPALTKAPNEKLSEFCVTISEVEDNVTFAQWGLSKMTGREILRNIPNNVGILVATPKKGAYISAEKIKELKEYDI